MTSHIAKKSLFIAIVIMTVLLSIRAAAIASTAKFTASVPPGGTNFPSAIGFSVAVSGGDSFSSSQIDFAAGVTGHNVVSEMESEMENLSSVEGNVSGNMLTVDNVSAAAVHGGGGGLDLWVDLDTMLDPCRNCVLDLDFAIPFRPSFPFRTLMLLAAGPDGQAVPIQSDGTFSLVLEFADDPVSPTTTFTLENTWSFNPSMTTTDLIQAIDTTLQSTAFPRDILQYVGLVDGFPTIGHDLSLRIISFRSSVETLDLSHPGFLSGVAALGTIPEPASLTSALVGLSVLYRLRVRKQGS